MFTKLLKLIINNFSIKLLALTLSFGLWAYVAAGENKVGDFPGSISLEAKNVSTNLAAILDIKEVKIRLIAEGSVWQKLSPESFTAYVDAIGLSEGTYELPVKVVSKFANVQIVETMPAQVLVGLSPIAIKKVPIEIKTEGKPAEGMTAEPILPEPNEIEIEGPKNAIEEVKKITAVIKLNGEKEDLVKLVNLETPVSVKINPSQLEIKVLIKKKEQSKTIGIKVRTKGSPASGFWISNIKSAPNQIDINGSPDLISSINWLETEEINIDGIAENKSFSTSLNIPSGLSIDDKGKTVRIEIELSSLNLNKEISAVLIYKNLSGSLKVESIDPSIVKVIVSGSSAKLASLKDDDIKLNLDLSNRPAGTHNIDLAKKDFTVPDGIEVISFFPSALTVKLSNK